MSVFRSIPETFPFNVPLKQRPVEFQLRCGVQDRVATVMLSVFWSVLITAVLYSWADPLAPWGGDTLLMRALAAAALGLFLIFGVGGYLWPAIDEVMLRVDVRIAESSVDVRTASLLRTREWTKPLAEYDGLLIENWGTRSIEDGKIPVAAVMLKHRDDRWSIPLVIDGALRVKASAARRKAEQLGLPLLDGAALGLPNVVAEDGRIVVNQFQSLKVRLLYALLSLGGLAAAGWLAVAGYTSNDSALLWIAVAAFCAAIAMDVFVRRYVSGMRDLGTDIEIETPALFSRPQRISKADIRGVDYREGRSTPGMLHAVHAPWVKIRVAGHRLPFIVDMQSEYVSEAALLSLRPSSA